MEIDTCDIMTGFKREFVGHEDQELDTLMAKAASGDVDSAKIVVAQPARLKLWLDKQAGRREGEDSLLSNHLLHSGEGSFWGYASGLRRPERFAERGLPKTIDDLKVQYAALKDKDGRADFKSDIQGLERAILMGSVDALEIMLDRSPMALWAMDFSLSEYEDENVLAFAAKYAPIGPDVKIVELLRDRGARLNDRRLNLVVGAAMVQGEGIWLKEPNACARALSAAGYSFDWADGIALLQKNTFERSHAPMLPRVAAQKVAWLLEIEKQGWADFSVKPSAEEWEAMLGKFPLDQTRPKRNESFLQYAKNGGKVGLGAWIAWGDSPLRDPASWADLGPWLCAKGLASEALDAAKASENMVTWSNLLPWAEREALSNQSESDEVKYEESKRSSRL